MGFTSHSGSQPTPDRVEIAQMRLVDHTTSEGSGDFEAVDSGNDKAPNGGAQPEEMSEYAKWSLGAGDDSAVGVVGSDASTTQAATTVNAQAEDEDWDAGVWFKAAEDLLVTGFDGVAVEVGTVGVVRKLDFGKLLVQFMHTTAAFDWGNGLLHIDTELADKRLTKLMGCAAMGSISGDLLKVMGTTGCAVKGRAGTRFADKAGFVVSNQGDTAELVDTALRELWEAPWEDLEALEESPTCPGSSVAGRYRHGGRQYQIFADGHIHDVDGGVVGYVKGTDDNPDELHLDGEVHQISGVGDLLMFEREGGASGMWHKTKIGEVSAESATPTEQASDLAQQQYEKAKTSVETYEATLRNLNNEIEANSAKIGHLEKHPGLHDVLEDCVEKRVQEYNYKICFFKNAYQDSVRLGNFDSTEGKRADFSGGDMCYGGPARSLIVLLECGVDTEILGVSEPSRCVYEARVAHSSACEEPSDESGKVLEPHEDEF